MAENQTPISGVAIAVVASGDFTLYEGFAVNEALASAWTTLLVSAEWFSKATLEFNGSKTLNLSIDIPGDVDPHWGGQFASDVAQRATAGVPQIPLINKDQINPALFIITGVTKQFLQSYGELAGLAYDETIAKLRTAYIESIIS